MLDALADVATVETTTSFLDGFDQPYRQLGRSNLSVSLAGFGCYRVDEQAPEHEAALRYALKNGINLIDTSSNYTDGSAERLVGQVLTDLVDQREIQRQQVVLVSKLGYIQGTNWNYYLQVQQSGKPFQEVVTLQQGLAHCIHPDFIADQLTKSLERLNVQTLDVLLLHNPEYFLSYAQKEGQLEEAKVSYYERLLKACLYLEEEVQKGRICHYGISSNTFPVSDKDPAFTCLSRVYEEVSSQVKGHHFSVIQLPFNFFETGAVTQANQPGGQSVLDFAIQKNIGVLVNRPLNAFSGDELQRLVDVAVSDQIITEEIIEDGFKEGQALEKELADFQLEDFGNGSQQKQFIAEQLALFTLLHQHWKTFGSIYRCQEIISDYLVPRLEHCISLLYELGVLGPEQEKVLQMYLAMFIPLSERILTFYKQQSSDQHMALKKGFQSVCKEEVSLQQMALRSLMRTEGVSSVLVGMRQISYVDDGLVAISAISSSDLGLPFWSLIEEMAKTLSDV